MTETALAEALAHARTLEQQARAAFEAEAASGTADEREAALAVVRLVIPLRRRLEGWIASRACRAVSPR